MSRIADAGSHTVRPWWALFSETFFAPSGAPSFTAYACIAVAMATGAILGATAPIGVAEGEQIAVQVLVGQEAPPLGAAPFEVRVQ